MNLTCIHCVGILAFSFPSSKKVYQPSAIVSQWLGSASASGCRHVPVRVACVSQGSGDIPSHGLRATIWGHSVTLGLRSGDIPSH